MNYSKEIIKLPIKIIRHYRNQRNANVGFMTMYNFANKFLKENKLPDITEEEKNEIDCYWKRFGIKYPDYSWWQMYYGVTGIHSPKFIPDPVAGIIYSSCNDQKRIKGWDDKNIYERILPDMHFPKSLCHCMKGSIYDEGYQQCKDDMQLEKLSERIYDRIGIGGVISLS